MELCELTDRIYSCGLKVVAEIKKSGFDAKFAGGCVRDRLLGIKPYDYDIATTATPDEICSIFAHKNYRIIPTGLDHGTVTVVYSRYNYEITTLREDVKTDGRHAEVEFGTSFEQDSNRRDFTINAMFEDEDGKIYDFHSGLEDIKNKILKFVGVPDTRIKEDYLRILRYYRFWAKLDFTPDLDSLQAIAQNTDGLQMVSKERITSELIQIFKAKSPTKPLIGMVNQKVYEEFFPKYDGVISKIEDCNKVEVLSEECGIFRMAHLISECKDKDKIDKLIKKTLVLSNKQSKIALHFYNLYSIDFDRVIADTNSQMEFLDECDKASGKEQSFINLYYPVLIVFLNSKKSYLDKILKIEKKYHIKRIAPIPISGNDISKYLEITPGKNIGIILKNLKKLYRNNIWEKKEEGLEISKKLLEELDKVLIIVEKA